MGQSSNLGASSDEEQRTSQEEQQMVNRNWKKVREKLLIYFELLIALLAPAFVMSVIVIAVGKSLQYSNQSIKFEESDPNTLITLNYVVLLIASGILTYCAFVVFYFLVRGDARTRGDKLVSTVRESLKGAAKTIIPTDKNVEQSESNQNDNN